MMSQHAAATDLLRALSQIRLRKAQALFYFLAGELNSFHRAEKIIDLFWQDSDAQRASSSYRQVIRHVRRDIGTDFALTLRTEVGQVCLEAPGRPVLRDEFRRAILSEEWDQPGADLIRDFLGYTTLLQGISNSFDSWLAITRSAYLATIREALDQRMARASTAESLRHPAEFALQIEPSNEAAVRILMNLDWQAGRSTRAIQRYDLLYSYLDEEFDQEPETETIELLAAIKLNPNGRPVPAENPQRRPEVSIAVSLLPQSDEIPAQMRSFGTVLFADLRMRMGRFREWRVLDDDGSEPAYVMVKLRPVWAMGQYQLYIDVQRSADRQLLWSEVIDRPDTDWESKVRMFLSNLAHALSVIVSDKSLADSGLGIYDRWLRAQSLLDAWSPATEQAALAMLDQITTEAPKFGPAHAELAGALNVRHLLQPGTRQTEEVKQSALHHAILAVSIDPLDTRAHRVLGWCYCHKQEFGLAEFHFEQALTLNPSNPLTLASSALGFSFCDNLPKAAALIEDARRNPTGMEPFHLIYLAVVDYLLGNFAKAAEQCRRGSGLMTTVGGWHSAALWKMGQHDQAIARLRQYFEEIRSKWQGNPNPPDAQIIDWFASCFPMRNQPALDDLRHTITTIATTDATA